jgi:hypothetical protein
VDRDGEGALGTLLADDVLVHELIHLSGGGDGVEQRLRRVDPAVFLLEDVLAEVGAVGADVNIVRPLDHGADLARALAAEGAGGHLPAAETAAGAGTASVAGAVSGPGSGPIGITALVSTATAGLASHRLLPNFCG